DTRPCPKRSIARVLERVLQTDNGHSSHANLSRTAVLRCQTPVVRSGHVYRGQLGDEFGVAEAGHDVVVDHARRLHEGVTDRRADEAEAAALQILAHRPRFLRLGRDLPELAEAPD